MPFGQLLYTILFPCASDVSRISVPHASCDASILISRGMAWFKYQNICLWFYFHICQRKREKMSAKPTFQLCQSDKSLQIVKWLYLSSLGEVLKANLINKSLT